MEEAPGVVFVVMRDAKVGGAYRGVRKAGVEGQWEFMFLSNVAMGSEGGVIVEGRRCRSGRW